MTYTTPDEAEHAFYSALQSADIEAMQSVWADDESIVCVHPASQPIYGPRSVRMSWAQIFRDGGTMRVRFECSSRTLSSILAVHVGYEFISVGSEIGDSDPMIATNVFQLTKGGWRMLLHHASPVHMDYGEMADDESLH